MGLPAFTVGIEEEFQIVDRATGELRSSAGRMLPRARRTLGHEVQPELHQSNIEAASPVCHTLSEVRQHLQRSRAALGEAAALEGCAIAAAGTHPFSRWQDQQITDKDRYRGIHESFAQVARENVIFGCHVHVGVDDPDMALEVMNRARLWLAPLLALTANSAFWLGDDTGYDSFRTELWWRWPLAGPPPFFKGRDEYQELVQALVDTGSVEDVSKIYWDVRLPDKVPTVEFRICDVGLTVDDGVMIAGLVRGLVRSCYLQALSGAPAPRVRSQLLKSAHWRAARHGLSATLIDVEAREEVPAATLLQRLLQFTRPGLEPHGEWSEVESLVQQTLDGGNGAARQRAALARRGTMTGLVDYLVEQTMPLTT